MRGRRARLRARAGALERAARARACRAPPSVIHNDANDHNVLVDGAADRVVGLLDLGDMVHSVTAARGRRRDRLRDAPSD